MSEFLFVERKSSEIMSLLAVAPIYRKQGTVSARQGVVGEKIITTLKNGSEETVNIVKNYSDWVVTNPSGERYIISAEKFFSRYEPIDNGCIFSAKGYCRAILNPFGKPIKIQASWGSPQTGNERCMIADTCNEEGKSDGEPYLIDGPAFAETYKPI